MWDDHLLHRSVLLERVVFGDRLQRARCAHMETFLQAKQILLLGEGDGRFLEALLAEGCRADIVCLDASTGMLDLAEKRTNGKANKVRFLAGDVRDFCLPQGFRPDVVGAHFFLDCFREEELVDIVGSIACGSMPGGTVVITDFKLPEGSRVRRLRGRLLIFVMLVFFRFFAGISARQLPDLSNFLAKLGWNCRQKALFDHGFISSWVMELPGNKRS